MKLGAEPKKVGLLVGLLVIAGITYYMASSDDPAPRPAPRPAAAPVSAVQAVTEAPVNADRKRVVTNGLNGEFKPMIGPKKGEARPDPTKIDPTLRLDLLAKVQNVQPASTLRNLFAFGAAQPSAPPIAMPAKPPVIPMGPQQITQQPVVQGPPPGPQGPPPPPPINLKYYGFKVSKSNGARIAFLMDGEDIIVTSENEMVKKRYKIIKIGDREITIEDTQFKSSQKLPLQEDAIG